ncbi:hypothetical protein [Alterisphingorhabdus coralli]|uniref:Uncharacterized protein n=1 Tax=Alterisphingorhabdus coralli TaxID=3071408 RepID=A0AA97FB06_9SPHN|nr:hypothetical protein [Parasphingorhabdus sp. SCSIO 66989]WOE76317.1 hypothetical protein RB602_06290 [Parasphingorhabdus sp. SCSIO 66989]
MTNYVAVNRIESRKDNKPVVTDPGKPFKPADADEAKSLLALGAIKEVETSAPADDKPLTVNEIKTTVAKLVKDNDAATLEVMLSVEEDGPNRSTAIKAIQDALEEIKAAGEGSEGDSGEEAASEGEGETTPSTEEGAGDGEEQGLL